MGRGSTGLIIAGVFFLLTSALFGWLTYSNYNRVARRPEAGGELGLRFQLDEKEGNRKTLEIKRDGLLSDLAAEQKKYREQAARVLDREFALQGQEIQKKAAEASDKFAKDWQAKVSKESPKATGRAEAAVAAYKARQTAAGSKNDARIKEINELIRKINEELAKFKKDSADRFEAQTKRRTNLRNLLDHYENEVAKLITREDPPGLGQLGRVMTSDPERNLAVVNLGTRHGVKAGMRFEVFQIRRGNHRVHKGHIEVKTAEAEVSICAILVKEVRLPRCPVCHYTAAQPEERFCPRCTSPGTSQGAQMLSDSPKVVIWGKSGTDPIVKGDLLFNPFFSPKKKKLYAISGQALIKRKAYSREAIKEAVVFHGNTVADQVSAKTDVLIALRGDVDVVKKAKELGIVIVYGFELFRYLEK